MFCGDTDVPESCFSIPFARWRQNSCRDVEVPALGLCWAVACETTDYYLPPPENVFYIQCPETSS